MDGKRSEVDVRRIYDILELSLSQAKLIQFPLVRYYHYLIINITADIHHRHLFLLLQTLAYHVLCKAAHLMVRFFGILYRGQVYVERRNIGSTGLEDPRAVDVRERGHAPINLLVRFNEDIFHIRTMTECKHNRTDSISGLSRNILQAIQLHQLLAQCLYDAFIHFTSRHLR